MSTLAMFVIGYLLISIGIGLYVSSRVKNSTDFILAGRTLPIYVVIATVFATWFGSEAVVGIPATFIQEGLGGIIADPFGAGMCLVFVGAFFAARLYRMKLLTIGDFFKKKYGKGVELSVAVAICISYLGWVSAQVVALGVVINLVSADAIGFEWSMVIGLATVLLYTVTGGMWSVVVTDFLQMIIIIIGLAMVAYLVASRYDGGATAIIQHAADHNKFDFWPAMDWKAIMAFFGTFVTLALGSIPQQDIFQRVMSSKNEKVAVRGTVIGGLFYIVFCFIPIFITYGATLLDPALLAHHMKDGDMQRILPEYIMGNTPVFIQVMFFGALLSAIMSTASGTLLAPSAIFAENILKEIFKFDDKHLLKALRGTVFGFGILVFGYSWLSQSAGLSIFEMVENAYLVTLCGAFVPLAFGVYWKKANNRGAVCSIILGVGTWVIMEILNFRHAETPQATILIPADLVYIIPPQLAGLAMAIFGMVAGSLSGGEPPKHVKAQD